MNLEEYGRVKEMSYDKYCDYLRGKYGCPKHDYPNVADARPSEGLFIHHIGENEIANLSNESIRVESDHKYQTPEMLCYCDWLEHSTYNRKVPRSSRGGRTICELRVMLSVLCQCEPYVRAKA